MIKEKYEDDLVLNTATRIPVCLCIDASASMNKVIGNGGVDTGKRQFIDGKQWIVLSEGDTLMKEMVKGVNKFYDSVRRNQQANLSCEISCVSFSDDASCIEDFSPVSSKQEFVAPKTGDKTAMAKGVELALNLLESRKNDYKDSGIEYHQPWLVIFTDGDSSDDVGYVQSRVKQLESESKLSVFTFALSDEVNMNTLSGFSRRKPLSIKTDKFEEFFEWLGKSVSIVSASRVGDKIKLDTSNLDDWAEL
ncbi:MAG: VWA domain-containing protein [bacterium]